MRLGIVVERDPGGRCSQPIAELRPLPIGGTFTIGREITADLVVSDRSVDRRSCIVRYDNGGFVLGVTATSGVRINQQLVRESHRLSPGDTLAYSSGVILRFLALDPLSALVTCQHWVRLSAWSSAVPHAGAAFSLRGGFRRGWLVSSRDARTHADDVFSSEPTPSALTEADLRAFVRRAGTREALPAVVESFVSPRTVHRVFAVDDHIDVVRFVERARPLPLPIALALGLRLAEAIGDLWLSARDPPAVFGVGFDGRVTWLPGFRLPQKPIGAPPQENVRWLFRLLDRTGAVQRLLASEPAGLTQLDEGLRRLARETTPAEPAEVAALVAGLFADEQRAAKDMNEQLELLDEPALKQLLARVSR